MQKAGKPIKIWAYDQSFVKFEMHSKTNQKRDIHNLKL